MDKKALLGDYVRLLDLLEDYYTDGERKHRMRTPEELRLPGPPKPVETSEALSSPAVQESAVSLEATGQPSRAEAVFSASAGMANLAREIMACTKCPLCRHRRLAVPGDGTPEPVVLVVGEVPDSEEDRIGLPFMGEPGEYLDKWLNAVQWDSARQTLDRDDNVFLTTAVKCHTPDNRLPAANEVAACFPYLQRQIALLKPKAILTAGQLAPGLLLKRSVDITSLRGKLYHYNDIPLIPTYHPVAVLNNPQLRSVVWRDLKLLINVLEKA